VIESFNAGLGDVSDLDNSGIEGDSGGWRFDLNLSAVVLICKCSLL